MHVFDPTDWSQSPSARAADNDRRHKAAVSAVHHARMADRLYALAASYPQSRDDLVNSAVAVARTHQQYARAHCMAAAARGV
jgi:hypothetical protein